MLSAMARELAERNGIGEFADAVWNALNREHRKLIPAASGSREDVASINVPRVFDDTQPNLRDIVKEAIADGSVLLFGQRPGSLGVSKVAEQGCPRAGIAIQFRMRNRREVSLSRVLLRPVFGRRRDAPNISRLVERQSEEPKLFVLSHRDAIHHARADAPACWKPL